MSLNLIRLIDQYLAEQSCQHRNSDRAIEHTSQHPEKELDSNGQQGHRSRDERRGQNSSGQSGDNL